MFISQDWLIEKDLDQYNIFKQFSPDNPDFIDSVELLDRIVRSKDYELGEKIYYALPYEHVPLVINEYDNVGIFHPGDVILKSNKNIDLKRGTMFLIRGDLRVSLTNDVDTSVRIIEEDDVDISGHVIQFKVHADLIGNLIAPDSTVIMSGGHILGKVKCKKFIYFSGCIEGDIETEEFKLGRVKGMLKVLQTISKSR
jgi:cytoskeletal protein CcmA (bactofilin family)